MYSVGRDPLLRENTKFIRIGKTCSCNVLSGYAFLNLLLKLRISFLSALRNKLYYGRFLHGFIPPLMLKNRGSNLRGTAFASGVVLALVDPHNKPLWSAEAEP